MSLPDSIPPEGAINAYAQGYFPMAEKRDDVEFFWVRPHERGILPIPHIHVPRRLQALIRQVPFEIRINTAFADVLTACAQPRPKHPESWINPAIHELFLTLHHHGYAHSLECWSKEDGSLVAGTYGLALGRAFFAESKFGRTPNASKIALVHLCSHLVHCGFTLLDTQFITPHLQQFGAIEISDAEYQEQLATALTRPATFNDQLSPSDVEPDAVLGRLQDKTHTS